MVTRTATSWSGTACRAFQKVSEYSLKVLFGILCKGAEHSRRYLNTLSRFCLEYYVKVQSIPKVSEYSLKVLFGILCKGAEHSRRYLNNISRFCLEYYVKVQNVPEGIRILSQGSVWNII